MTEITITSSWDGRTWTGPATSPDLEAIFREFNRVDEHDSDRLEDMGYDLPSLSAGDLVTVEGRTYYCANVGWTPLSDAQITKWHALDPSDRRWSDDL